MKRRIYDDELHCHFLTFSCYRRRRLLDDDQCKRIVIGTLASQLSRQNARCVGFVIMPDHVHGLLWLLRTGELGAFMKQWKQRSSVQIQKVLQRCLKNYASKIPASDPVWQPRYYPFNVLTERKIEEKLDYMHFNPVRAGLVAKATDWPWSSARYYIEGRSVGVPIQWPP